MEKQDIYDENRCKTGKLMLRGQSPLPGEFHLIVHICIFQGQKKLLIQQRCSSLHIFPGKWDVSVGGHVLSGENTQQAALRELREELGITADPSQLSLLFTRRRPHSFDDFFLLDAPVELSGLQLQTEEVQAVRWARQEEILSMIRTEEFLDYPYELISELFIRALAFYKR